MIAETLASTDAAAHHWQQVHASAARAGDPYRLTVATDALVLIQATGRAPRSQVVEEAGDELGVPKPEFERTRSK